VTQLGKLLDRDALDGDGGARAKVKIEVPAAWAAGAALVEVSVPRTLVCARCEGGGCDGCGRSGALRGPAEAAARVVRVRLPAALGDGVAMRIAEPFGRAETITQLWIEVRPALAPSASVRRLSGPPRQRTRILPRMVLGLTILVLLLGGVLALLTWARR
jgi:hypothetical protein